MFHSNWTFAIDALKFEENHRCRSIVCEPNKKTILSFSHSLHFSKLWMVFHNENKHKLEFTSTESLALTEHKKKLYALLQKLQPMIYTISLFDDSLIRYHAIIYNDTCIVFFLSKRRKTNANWSKITLQIIVCRRWQRRLIVFA